MQTVICCSPALAHSYSSCCVPKWVRGCVCLIRSWRGEPLITEGNAHTTIYHSTAHSSHCNTIPSLTHEKVTIQAECVCVRVWGGGGLYACLCDGRGTSHWSLLRWTFRSFSLSSTGKRVEHFDGSIKYGLYRFCRFTLVFTSRLCYQSYWKCNSICHRQSMRLICEISHCPWSWFIWMLSPLICCSIWFNCPDIRETKRCVLSAKSPPQDLATMCSWLTIWANNI